MPLPTFRNTELQILGADYDALLQYSIGAVLSGSSNHANAYGWSGAAWDKIGETGNALDVNIKSGGPTGYALDGTLTGGSLQAKVIGIEGANQRQVAVDASGKLTVVESSASDIKTAVQNLDADGKVLRKTFAAVGVVDGGEVQITGLTPNGEYVIAAVRSTPATTGGAATARRRRIYEATGGAAADLAWEEPTAPAIADGAAYPYGGLGMPAKADAAGKLWLRYSVTGAGDINETGVVILLPRRSV
jgi:hypothetical protein